MNMIQGISWTNFVESCGYAKDALEGFDKSFEWANLAGSLSEEQLEYCQNLISHSSLGLSLPELGTDFYGLYSGSYANLSLHVNKTVGGALHVWKDLSSLSYSSLGYLETPVELVCEMTDMVGNVAELAKEVGEAAWHVPHEAIVGSFNARGFYFDANNNPAKVLTSKGYDTAVQDSVNRSWLLCIKTAGIASYIALGVFGITTLLGGGAIVAALITPVGILALGSAALVLKVAGNVFEKTVCGPCLTC